MSNDNQRPGTGPNPRHLITILAFCLVSDAFAQGVLEEVTVTAQKREQNVQDVGIAITAFTGDQMRALGVERSFDIAAFSPGVHISGNLAGQNTQFTIRGVTQNDFNDVVEAPNAVYLDEGYFAIAQAQTFAVFDIDRVEILKGPQGTLFGRNATGGLVQYISRKPNFERVEGFADFTYGIFDSDASADQFRFEGAVGGPLSQSFAGRAAIMYDQHDGYLENIYPFSAVGGATFGLSPGNSPGLGAGADMGDDDTIAGRGILMFQPNEDSTFTLSVNAAHTEVATGPYQSKATIGVYNGSGNMGELINVIDVAPNETRESIAADGSDNGSDQANGGTLTNIAPRPLPGGDFFGYKDPDGEDFTTSGDFAFADQGETQTWGLNGRIEHQLTDNILITSVTDFKDYEKLLFIDVDSAPVNQLANYAGVDATSFTQELRANGETDRSRWVMGFYFLNINSNSDNGLKAPANSLPVVFGGLPPGGADIGVQAQLETKSYSLFGQLEYDLNDQITLIGGLRLIKEEKEFNMRQGLFFSTGPSEVNVGNPFVPFNSFQDDTSDTLFTGKLQVDWHARDNLLIYAGVNRGVKAGSFNAPIPGGLPIPNSALPYKEEILISVEGGFKASFFDGTTRLNGSAFYYDYSDYQSFLFTGVSGVVINADAENKGLELELQTSPIDGLDALLSFSWFDATVKDVPLRVGSPLPPVDVDPTYAPEVQVTGLLRYAWPLFSGMMAIQGDFSYSDEYFYNLRNFDADKFDSYVMVNSRLGWTSQDGHWEAAFSVNNVTDERAGIQGFDLASLCGCNEISFQPPRWYGFSVKYAY
jgi:iron complex outermembrane receptor protein